MNYKFKPVTLQPPFASTHQSNLNLNLNLKASFATFLGVVAAVTENILQVV